MGVRASPVVAIVLLVVASLHAASGSAGLARFSPAAAAVPLRLSSPGGDVTVTFAIKANPRPYRPGERAYYRIAYKGVPILRDSPLGLELLGAGALACDFEVVDTTRRTEDSSWENRLGTRRVVFDRFNEMTVSLRERLGLGRRLDIVFRAYDDGVAFRYVMPEQASLREFVLAAEETGFYFAGEPAAIARNTGRFNTRHGGGDGKVHLRDLKPASIIDLPLLVETPGGPWAAIVEADLTDYAGLHLGGVSGFPNALTARLSPAAGRTAEETVVGKTPKATPWRVVMLAPTPGRLADMNDFLLNLNPPSALVDTSWVTPGKAAWARQSGTHDPRMDTATLKRYVDFASAHGLEYVCIDAGWSPPGKTGDRDEVLSPTADVDVPGIITYARGKGVRIILSVDWRFLNVRMDETLALLETWGAAGVELHGMNRDDQEVVSSYEHLVREAATHRLIVDVHGTRTGTGIDRTYPNLLASAGVTGMLADRIDVTPDAFRHAARGPSHSPDLEPVSQGTRARQLAMFVVVEGPLVLLPDDPDACEHQPGLEFLERVPAVWDETRIPGGQPGELLVAARRHGREWYVGAATNREARDIDVPLDFLGPGSYDALLFVDGQKADIGGSDTRTERRTLTAAGHLALHLAPGGGAAVILTPSAGTITVKTLLGEMVDFDNLAREPWPPYKSASASSFSRASIAGGEAWFDNDDAGQYVRTETNDGRTEHVLADLRGPGTVTRFWSANPDWTNTVRFYFDGELRPRVALPLKALFSGQTVPFGPTFSYLSGMGGNLYYPLPYGRSLKITIEETDKFPRLYYQVGYRTYRGGARVETFDPARAGEWADAQKSTAAQLEAPGSARVPADAAWRTFDLTVQPGQTAAVPELTGPLAVYEWSARVRGTREDGSWTDPLRAHNAYRYLLLEVDFDGRAAIRTPLGDFFGSGPGVNPYHNLLFTVAADGTMTSRLLMPFRSSMQLRLANAGRSAYDVEVRLRVGARAFDDRDMHLRAQWGALTRDSWPLFDWNVLTASGAGKVVGTVYEIANPVLIWWGEGDQKIFVDGEPFPSTFGTGTEDDYGFAYGYNGPFARPYHAQTRVDGPASGGHISLNRWYVLDAMPYRDGLRFDQEMWHWMPCRPTWSHVVYWYAAPGTPGPQEIDRAGLAPVDLGIRANMLDPQEAENLPHETTGGVAAKERLANCSEAEHLVWRGAEPGDRLTVRFSAPEEARYSIELNLAMSPDYGRYRFFVNGEAVPGVVDCYSPTLYWLHPTIGVFRLRRGENVLTVESLVPNPAARTGSVLGLDYIFLVKQ
jgi:alpha-glucosidase